ncbi:hypothetical protein C1J01_14810 [Nonomuraea aridisoli]|uniref:Uncharacterized protein n=2 Tax=Nonomuraea aridisoli TaxID=2070368 RepID=A0A2W2EY76_9ACTN|nr:hypothetical protein [Nonomuraea aridisoli]PZG18520.1 hypothetical protein C1J01_14810 [Nonomuraea aridisoli]
MIVMDAVLETYDAEGFTAWPIAEPPDDRILALSGGLTPAEVGTAMAVIVAYAGFPAEPVADLHLTLDRHLVEAECLIAPGGVRVTDTVTGARILPGCCCGLESWREWADVLHGESPWLGHGPDTDLEHTGEAVRLRQEPSHQVELPLADLPGLLSDVHAGLRGFLELVGAWAGETCPRAAGRLVAVLDESFHVTGSLDLG